MKVLSIRPITGNYFPAGLKRLDYQSAVDGVEDWALFRSGKNLALWIIVLHGHGSTGDQLFTRQDIREAWLPKFMKSGAGILSVNLRGNAWMSPAATADLHALLKWMRAEQGLEETLFYSGSMGGTSNLIYAVLHPEDVDVVVALGAATDIASYYSWCLDQSLEIAQQIAEAIKKAYGGNQPVFEARLQQHSVLKKQARLTMPVYLGHGASDILIPVEQARNLAQAMQCQKYFYYHEISGGNHDSPLWDEGAWEFVKKAIGLGT